MQRIKKLLAIGVLALSSAGCSQTSSPEEPRLSLPAIEERLKPAADNLATEGFSGFVMVAQGEKDPIFLPMGRAAEGPYNLDTQFDIGSITKPITGLALAKLVTDGKVSLDDTLADHFQNVPEDKAGITIEQLMTHTAGLGPAHGFDLRAMSKAEMLEAVFSSDLIHPPGESYAYSNMGPSLVAAIIEDVVGAFYEEHVTQGVLAELGATSTGYHSVYDAERSTASESGDKVATASWGDLDPVSWALIGNGGMVSTARDLHLIGQAAMGSDVSADVHRIWTTPRVDEMGGTKYGLGIGWQEMEGLGEIYWHNSGNPAFQTEWWTVPKHDMTIVLHRNGGPIGMAEALGPVLSAITGKQLAFGDGSADVDMTPSDSLPEGADGELAAALLAAIRADDDTEWGRFIDQRMASALLDMMPREEHMQMRQGAKADIAGRRVSAWGRKEGELHIRLAKEGAPPMMFVLYHMEEDGILKMRGMGVN